MKSLSKYQKLYHCQYIYMYQSKFHLTNLKTWSLKQNCSKHLFKKKKKTMVVRFVALTKLPEQVFIEK